MRESLLALCENFIENRAIVKKVFAWEDSNLHPICAAMFTDKHQIADGDKIKNCREILKKQTGLLSDFRGTVKAIIVTMMALSTDPEERLKNALILYKSLKEHFFASDYLAVAAMIISGMVKPVQYEETAVRTRQIYDLMKKEHPFLTSGRDSVFAALLALSELTDEKIVSQTENCYDILKHKFHLSESLQSLSHVLALGEGTAEHKCDRTLELFEAFKEKKNRYSTNYELATLGVLALLPGRIDTISDDVIEVSNWLNKQKNYGFFDVDKRVRLMHAGMIVTSDYINGEDNSSMSSAAIGATIALIVAQQAALLSAVTASSVAASSASSN